MRRLIVLQRIISLLVLITSITMIPPIFVSIGYADGEVSAFVISFLILFSLGLLAWYPVRNYRQDLRLRDGFLVVLLSWSMTGLASTLPLLLLNNPQLSITDAFFETFSGLTTTGATVLTGLDSMTPSLLYYRQQIQWLGGMGIVVLAVAVLPMLRIGGMQLYRVETPGPMKDNKLTPRITETAKALWLVYLGITVICALAYWLAGMSAFDAIGHAYSTVAIGGFSTHDASIGYFDSVLIESVCLIFMLISGVNFGLHFVAWRKATITPYTKDPEFKAYWAYLFFASILCSAGLYFSGSIPSLSESIRQGLFQVVSVGTTTGFATSGFYMWPGFITAFLILISCVGGCAGSTAGGLKVMRIVIMFRHGLRELKRLIHPSAIVPVKLGGKSLNPQVFDAVWGFFSLYLVSFWVISLFISATGTDLITAFSTVAACLNNLGPALGDAGAHYADLNSASKWALCFAMLLGRLEFFTLLVILTPAFWRE